MTWLRRLFGLCIHEWMHVTDETDDDGRHFEGLICRKCFRVRYRQKGLLP